MLRFLTDENFNEDIVRGLLRRVPGLDVVGVREVGLAGASDPVVLEWAAADDRIVLSYDRTTMPDFAFARLGRGEPMPGVFLLRRRVSIRRAIEELVIYCEYSEQTEWAGQVRHLPT